LPVLDPSHHHLSLMAGTNFLFTFCSL
jgi:hypothetical protein